MDENGLPLLPLVLDGVPDGLRYVLAQEGVPFCDRGGGPPRGRFVLVDSSSATRRTLSPGELPIDIARLREMSQGDPLAAIVDRRTARVQWTIGPWQLRGRLPHADRRTLRREVVEFLRSRVERLGGVWLRLAAFPFPYRSVLNWRVDCHEPEECGVDVPLATAVSRFVSPAVATDEDALASLLGRDLGVFADATFASVNERSAALAQAIKALASAGIVCRGAASTQSSFDPRFSTILERLGVEHLTGAVGYDEMPWFSPTGGLLHVPVHPISLSMFLRAARQGSTARWSPSQSRRPSRGETEAAETASDYFGRLLESRCRSGEPALLWSRACDLAEHPDVLAALARRLAELPALWPASLTDLAVWWRARAAARVSVTREDGRLAVVCRHLPSDRVLAIEYCRGDHAAVLPLERERMTFSPESLVFENRRPRPLVRPVRLDPAQRFRPAGKIASDEKPVVHPIKAWARRQIRRLWG